MPRNPVENWEQVRDEWVAAVERFIAEAEGWAKGYDWGTLRSQKTIDEDRLGAYTVPRLLIHRADLGRFQLDPVCRFVEGAEGLVDLYVIPSYDSSAVVRAEDGLWYTHDARGGRVSRRPWSGRRLDKMLHDLHTDALRT